MARWSQAFAALHCRCTVAIEMSNTSDVSWLDSPPKNLSSTTLIPPEYFRIHTRRFYSGLAFTFLLQMDGDNMRIVKELLSSMCSPLNEGWRKPETSSSLPRFSTVSLRSPRSCRTKKRIFVGFCFGPRGLRYFTMGKFQDEQKSIPKSVSNGECRSARLAARLVPKSRPKVRHQFSARCLHYSDSANHFAASSAGLYVGEAIKGDVGSHWPGERPSRAITSAKSKTITPDNVVLARSGRARIS